MRKLSLLLLMLCFVLCIFASCTRAGTNIDTDNSSTSSDSSNTSAASTEIVPTEAESDMFTNRDYDNSYDEGSSVRINLNGSTATATSNSVQIANNIITITEEATYILSGTLDDGMIIVNAPNTAKLQLVLKEANIHCETSAALYILKADKVFVTLADGTENTLSCGETFTQIDDNNIDGALFSKQDLTLNGTGSLTVTAPGGHGIVCKDDLVLTGGTYTIHAACHGFDVNDSVRVTDTVIIIDAGKDGIHAENSEDTSLGFVYVLSGTLQLEAEGDGISAGAYLQIENGTFDIFTGGGSENGTKESSDFWGGFMGGRPGASMQSPFSTDSSTSDDSTSMKGMKATGDLLIHNGAFAINSADDSVHSNASITVYGGAFTIASGDDGFHADETLTIADGEITISESYEGLEALHVVVNGGNIRLTATDDGINAAGGADSSGTGGRGGDRFGGMGPGGSMRGEMSSSSGGSIEISGGNLYINASGDGIDANGSLTISGGYITICGPTAGDTATLDYDTTGVITGGTFIGTGASNMAQSFSDSDQGVVAVSINSQSAGTTITVQDSNGSTLLSWTPELDFDFVIVSIPDLVRGETYTIAAGSTFKNVTAS